MMVRETKKPRAARAQPQVEVAYQFIRTQLLGQKGGDHRGIIMEGEICELVNASRTPVREALRRLEGEGFVEILPNRGILIKSFGLQEIMEINEIRLLLEPYAARRAARLAPDGEIEALLSRLEASKLQPRGPEQLETVVEIDLAMHELVRRSAGNRRLEKLMDDLNLAVKRTRVISSPARVEETQEENERILRALLARDEVEAEKAMREHLENALRNVSYLRP